MQKYTHDRLPTDERPFRKKSRTTSLRFLLPKLGLILLVAVATTTMAIQSAYGLRWPMVLTEKEEKRDT